MTRIPKEGGSYLATGPLKDNSFLHVVTKSDATFADVLATVRQHIWDTFSYSPSACTPDLLRIPRSDLCSCRKWSVAHIELYKVALQGVINGSPLASLSLVAGLCVDPPHNDGMVRDPNIMKAHQE